ncbi:sensor histidine kinase [Aeromicrobium ponti]|uniref:histidine kinase n=1 Tax=Cytobacillus oceanisediminis TaxID=665099 RepID=A0A562JRV1_9BACI|nr:sensor histidine kinase [Cytobacillus oceanisediminis]TWH85715.1 two-component system sensor histidine kinase YesM [Cytobacillus oceanisediminis]
MNSIQFHIALSFSLLILCIILIIGLVSYQKYTNTLKENVEEYNFQLTKQVKENIDYYIRQMDDISYVIQSNGKVQSYFSSDEQPKRGMDEEEGMKELFQSLGTIRNDIVSIFIFGYDGKIVSSNPDQKIKSYIKPQDFEWYRKAQHADGKVVFTPSHVNTIVENPRWVVSLSRELQSMDGREKKGVLLIDLNYQILEEICSRVKLGDKGYVFIVDHNGKIVFHPEQQSIYSQLKKEKMKQILQMPGRSFIIKEKGERKIYTVANSELTGWKIVSVNDMKDIIIDEREIQDFIFTMILISIFLAGLVAIALSTWISNPIKQLEKSMKQVENGNFDIKVDTRSKNEVGRLSLSFNLMTRKIKELMNQILDEQRRIRKSELKALQAQINPHFLYNTLESIIWMAEFKKNDEVVEMTSSLAKLFRISLNKGKDAIPIQDEIEHVRNYLVIQKMRYKSKLDYMIEIDSEMINVKIIKLILQPLVENAIYHGIKNKDGKGFIHIVGKQDQGQVILQVIDNGVGMDEQQLRNIFLEKEGTSKRGSGVGVRNVKERLDLYYGDDYDISFDSTPNQGTVVTIAIPVTNFMSDQG